MMVSNGFTAKAQRRKEFTEILKKPHPSLCVSAPLFARRSLAKEGGEKKSGYSLIITTDQGLVV
jgi:hypothetical protein